MKLRHFAKYRESDHAKIPAIPKIHLPRSNDGSTSNIDSTDDFRGEVSQRNGEFAVDGLESSPVQSTIAAVIYEIPINGLQAVDGNDGTRRVSLGEGDVRVGNETSS